MTKPLKVRLEKTRDYPWLPKGHAVKHISHALPFFLSHRGKYFHRIRSSNSHCGRGNLSHMSVTFWCGDGGSVGENGRIDSEVPSDGVLGANCAGKVVGAGLDGDRIINGRRGRYSPRKDDCNESPPNTIQR